MVDTGRQHRPAAGIAFMLFAVFGFSVMDAIVKWMGETHPVPLTMVMRAMFGILPILAATLLLNPKGQRLKALHPGPSFKPHLIRGLLILLAQVTFFTGIVLVPLAEGIALVFAAPLFVTGLSILLLGEKVGPRRWVAIGIGAVGVAVITQPSGGILAPGSLLVLAAAFFYAATMVTARVYAVGSSAMAMTLWASLVAGLGGLIALPFVWQGMPDGADMGLYMIMGVVGGCAALAMTQAFRIAEASLLAPMDYTALAWATLFGWWFWQEVPDPLVWIGVALVAVSGLYILERERRVAPMTE
ncbi:DMT family transporter [Magnetospira sp. QH-2]|uniref:DMT family transporter n=1 Tax=Magnetospira sp. (strain QH-2) TaxID=1288970 RepID=UPI0003E81444|nr:DMT family transporter [Magnetospira sp. QH-2]CCQ75192.1 conserved membrane protein of unknown function [Magnetospira sp. QH-2]